MKRVYEKPTVYIEDLMLSQSIASSCYGIANFAEDICSVTVSAYGMTINIFEDKFICEYIGSGLDGIVCYHAPADNTHVFSS